jgi:hypothetical protein
MPIHKLAMGPIALNVVAAEQTEGQFGTQVLFTGDDNTQVYVSLASATGQLQRIGLTIPTSVGQRLHFEQVKKDGKTFTNILRAGAAPAGAPASAPAMASAAAPKMGLDEIAALYGQCVSHALDQLYRQCEDHGIGVNAEAIQAAAATMFIKATR